MEQQVRVIAVEKGEALVRGRRASACGDCAGKTSCSTMGSWVERAVDLRVKNILRAQPGDEVVLDVPDSAVMKIAFRLYAIPMLVFVLFGLLVRTLALSMGWPAVEAMAALAGLAGVLIYYVSYKVYLSKHSSGLDVRMKCILYSASSPRSSRASSGLAGHASGHQMPIQVVHSLD